MRETVNTPTTLFHSIFFSSRRRQHRRWSRRHGGTGDGRIAGDEGEKKTMTEEDTTHGIAIRIARSRSSRPIQTRYQINSRDLGWDVRYDADTRYFCLLFGSEAYIGSATSKTELTRPIRTGIGRDFEPWYELFICVEQLISYSKCKIFWTNFRKCDKIKKIELYRQSMNLDVHVMLERH